jgi:hypothetical protein
MSEPIVRFPVTCPQCGAESIGTFPLTDVAAALIECRRVNLFAGCHSLSWDASDVEQAQIREYLAVMWHEEQPARPRPDSGSQHVDGLIVL